MKKLDNKKLIARFQTWDDGGERRFANKVFTNEHDVEADMKMSANSIARTEYKEFSSEAEAWAWLQKEEELA